jgi:hypothetical protein
MTLMETAQLLGNFGEFVGAFAVVATLLFLAVQVKHSKESVDANTKALEESRRLAQAQTYQARVTTRIGQLQLEAESDYIAPLLDKLEGLGWPENRDAFDALTSLEQRRLKAWLIAGQRQMDNYHYQYEQGFIEEEYWENVIVPGIRMAAQNWDLIAHTGFRPRFKATVDRILAGAE